MHMQSHSACTITLWCRWVGGGMHMYVCLALSFSHSNLLNILANSETLLILEALIISIDKVLLPIGFNFMTADCQDRIQLHKCM